MTNLEDEVQLCIDLTFDGKKGQYLLSMNNVYYLCMRIKNDCPFQVYNGRENLFICKTIEERYKQ